MVAVLVNTKYLRDLYFKIKRYLQPLKKHRLLFLIGFAILLAIISLLWLPIWRVSQFGINNATENATLENQYRVTIAQILGGIAIGLGLYYTWQRNNIAQDGQITDRFTKGSLRNNLSNT